MLVWNRDSSRSGRVGMGWKWTKRRTGGTGGNQDRPTQRVGPAVRAPASDGFNSLVSTCEWIGANESRCRLNWIRDKDHAALKLHRASVAALSAQWQEDLGEGEEKEHKVRSTYRKSEWHWDKEMHRSRWARGKQRKKWPVKIVIMSGLKYY